jgi:single-stranded DNA-specific DHH superfamily exonuclease
MRVVTNVKNRQTKAQDAGLATIESMIEQKGLLNHKVLLFLLEPGQVDRNIAGLIANKIMAKYQRPVCLLTKITEYEKSDIPPWEVNESATIISYQGSARGC